MKDENVDLDTEIRWKIEEIDELETECRNIEDELEEIADVLGCAEIDLKELCQLRNDRQKGSK